MAEKAFFFYYFNNNVQKYPINISKMIIMVNYRSTLGRTGLYYVTSFTSSCNCLKYVSFNLQSNTVYKCRCPHDVKNYFNESNQRWKVYRNTFSLVGVYNRKHPTLGLIKVLKLLKSNVSIILYLQNTIWIVYLSLISYEKTLLRVKNRTDFRL